MKLSDKPTAYLLVKANTSSQCASCNFAIVHITEDWKEEQRKRLELLAPLYGNKYFHSVNFYDTAVSFYSMDENGRPDVDKLLGNTDWAFVVLGKNETQSLTPPESPLDCYRIALRPDGTGHYTAYGKHTSDEFWTESILFTQIIL